MMPPKGDIVNIVSNDNETSTLLSFAVTAGIVGALQQRALYVNQNRKPWLSV
ncbi:hypothetical protein DPMN_100881 [Dreissena polymorpha]|uniref:Uncharacterized protein n=1 Tax=Dreissena polymorpha TaxID=45954 RepID=A0A9D4LGN3_DREPO|nr:hypothetical protein DPMN_100881 [Dreissena polymorpha]